MTEEAIVGQIVPHKYVCVVTHPQHPKFLSCLDTRWLKDVRSAQDAEMTSQRSPF